MHLHDEFALFENLINRTSEHKGINEEIIEKDYYVTLLLKSLVSKEPHIIFKGGTSLSKCYKLINRFSEDIDLNYDNGDEHLTEGQRKNLSVNVREIARHLNFELSNEEDIRSRRYFNKYDFLYQTKYNAGGIKKRVIVETAVAMRSFPTEYLMADSFICRFLQHENRGDIISQYGLDPFEVAVQTKERTFIDNVFAICDYFLLGKIAEHSRHLYDLYKLFPHIIPDNSFKTLIREVRTLRSSSNICPSAGLGMNIGALLSQIINEDIYLQDYISTTKPLLFENCSYETVKETLKQILVLDIF